MLPQPNFKARPIALLERRSKWPKDVLLMVFMYYPGARNEIKTIFSRLCRAGGDFYSDFIEMNPTILQPSLRTSEKLIISNYAADSSPGFVLPYETLIAMGNKVLKDYRLEKIETGGSNSRLTFCFSGGVRAPPAGTYQSEPSESFVFPDGEVLR